MDNRILTKIALLNALEENDRSNPHSEAFTSLLESLTPEQKKIIFQYFRFRCQKRLLTVCRHMDFRDPLLRNVSFSGDPGIRKAEAAALVRVKKNRKNT